MADKEIARSNISEGQNEKLAKFFTRTLDKNDDGVVNWSDFEAAIEKMVPLKETALNSRLKIVRLRTEQNFKKYFTDLCEKGDANGDGDIDLNEWLDVMDSIIGNLRETDGFPEWYEGLHKALFRSNEFFDDRDVKKFEFVRMMQIWDINEEAASEAFDYVTENGEKKMDYALFSDLLKKFFTTNEKVHPINLGL